MLGARFALALLVVLATFHPTGHSYFHWVREALADGTAGPLHAFLGVLSLGVAWAHVWRRVTGRVIDEDPDT